MKKLICILCSGLFLGACASVSNVESDTYEPGKRPTLTQIRKIAEGVYAISQNKEAVETLDDEQKEFLAKLKDWEKREDVEEFKKYAERPITGVDIFTMDLALEEDYTMEEIDKFLNLGLYVKNPYCENEYKSYEVFQVLPKYVLAKGCEVKSYSECGTINSKIFMYPKQEDELYFDQKILTPPNGFCSTYIGIYEYESMDKMPHTVPILTFLQKTISKKQLEGIQKLRKELSE